MRYMKAGPQVAYRRESTLTIRLSLRAKRLLLAKAKRLGISVGDLTEHLIRTRVRTITREEVPIKQSHPSQKPVPKAPHVVGPYVKVVP